MPSPDPVETGRKGGLVRSERKAAANRAHGFKKREPGVPAPASKTSPAPAPEVPSLPWDELDQR